MRLHINHTTTRYSSWRGNSKIHRLEDHVHIGRHLNDFTTHKTQLFIVIKHSVHIFNPDGIDRTIKDQPSTVFNIHATSHGSVPHSKYTIEPIVTHFIEATIELAHCNRFGVKNLDMSLHFIHETLLFALRKCSCENLYSRSLACEGQAHNHEAVSNNHHFVELNDFLSEVINILKVVNLELVLNARVKVSVVGLWEHNSWEKITGNVPEKR
mmetsp:Transcript_116650/g.161923  ORF Transcript_116650/g.161923 Transcript_116650/m.161923 type:complete len:212 (+) Transcript_116650:1266-1901(+)